MNIAAIGVGGAGGTLLNRLVGHHGIGSESPVVTAATVDTDSASLDGLGNIPPASRHAVGQFETGGEGTDGDRELATSVVDDQRLEIRRTVEDGIKTTADAIVLFAGLAGGTGSALTPALASDLGEVYDQSVYTVSVLPAESETDLQAHGNTAAALQALESATDGQIVFDNDAWLWGSRTLESHGRAINRAFVSRLGELLTVGEAGTASDVGEQVVDASDVLATIDGGGCATIGYASTPLSKYRESDSSVFSSLKRRVTGDQVDESTRENALTETLERAARGTLTFECPPESAARGLVAFTGPPEWLRRDAIARGRNWVVDRTGTPELRSGDNPTPGGSSISVLLLFAGITDTPRIQEFTTGTENESSNKVN